MADTHNKLDELIESALTGDYGIARDMAKNARGTEEEDKMNKIKDKAFKKFSKSVDDSPMGKPLPADKVDELFGNDSLTSDEEEDDFLGVKTKVKESHHQDPSDESSMAQSQLVSILSNATDLMQMIQNGDQLDAWVQAKLTKAEDYLDSVKGYIAGEEKMDAIDSMMDPEMGPEIEPEVDVDSYEEMEDETPSALQQLSKLMEEGKYPWDKCIADQEGRYGSKDIAEKVCGSIKAGK